MSLLQDDPDTLEQAETNTAFGDIAKNYGRTTDHPLGDKETNAFDDTLNNGYNVEGTPGKRKIRSIFTKKRVGIAGGVTGTLIGGGLFGLSMISGPLSFINLSQQLQRSSLRSENDSSMRMRKMVRYFKGGDVGATRIGKLSGKFIAGPALENLKAMGVTIESGRIGAPTKTIIDFDKLSTKYPDVKDMSAAERKTFLAEKLDIPKEKITGSGSKFTIEQSKMGISESRLLLKNNLGLLEDGKILTGMRTRVLAKYFNLPSLFHPLDRSIAKAENKLLNGKGGSSTTDEDSTPTDEEKNKTPQEIEDEKIKGITDPLSAGGDAALDAIKVKEKLYNNAASKALTFTGYACMVKDTAGQIIKVNRARVVLPAVATSLRFIAIGEQIRAGGDDITQQELEKASQSLYDKDGNSVFDSRPMQALNPAGRSAQGPDISAEHQQAFSSKTKASTINGAVNKVLGGDTSATAICSPVGLIGQAALSVGLAISSVVGEVASGGTLTPAVVGVWAAKQGAQMALVGVLTTWLQHVVVDKGAAKIAFNELRGPELGHLLAYGSREAANMAAIAGGGISLGNEKSVLALEDEPGLTTFRNQSMFARLFDTHNPQSLVGRMAMSINPNVAENITTFGRSFLQIGPATINRLASLIPGVSAAEEPYDWTAPQYGIPQDMQDDPDLQDPYVNAENVAKIFDEQCANNEGGITDCKVAKRINACFGNTLIKDDSGDWDVTYDHDIDTHEESYEQGNCDDIGSASNKNPDSPTRQWRRIIMFVMDSHTAKAAACYQGDDTSCTETGDI